MAYRLRGEYAAEKIKIEDDDSDLDKIPTPTLRKLAKTIIKNRETGNVE